MQSVYSARQLVLLVTGNCQILRGEGLGALSKWVGQQRTVLLCAEIKS